MSKNRHSIFNTQFITATISTTLVLVLLGTIVLFVITAQNLSTFVKENINVSVLMKVFMCMCMLMIVCMIV
jgi:cell division transport system permease protein